MTLLEIFEVLMFGVHNNWQFQRQLDNAFFDHIVYGNTLYDILLVSMSDTYSVPTPPR